MLTLFIRGLPHTTTDTDLMEVFTAYGKVFNLKINRDLYTGQARGTATVDMEGHEARAAAAALNRLGFQGKTIYVNVDTGPKGSRGRR